MLSNQEKNYFYKPANDSQLITLIGMMGAGKSKFGNIVAKNLDFNFYDADSLIEEQFDTSIKKIFELHGETYFRKIEKEKIKTVVNSSLKLGEKAIISLGGGAFDNQYTRDLLLLKTKVIWLNVPLETLIQRIGDGKKRPMIEGDVKKSINKILNKRIKYYSLSHYQLNTQYLSQEQITNKIEKIILPENKKDEY